MDLHVTWKGKIPHAGEEIETTPQRPMQRCQQEMYYGMGHPPMHREETLLRRWLLDAVPMLRTQDIPTTILCAAMAGLWGLIIQLIPVVVGEFLTCLNIPGRHNPDDTPELFGLAVGLTRVINIACRVLAHTPINGISLIQAKDIGIASG